MMKFLLNCKSIKVMTLLVAVSSLSFTKAYSQGGCIEIKSILVDACGTPEGENEMVRFDVGSAALNVSAMTVDWANNNWLGLCQDPGTASIVTSINQSIQGCGSVVEPVGGVLPANSKVLIVTSTNFNAVSNSFSTLNEDLIILFQCAGNSSGHFANYNILPGMRGLSISFAGACTDTVTYDRTLLINQFGVIGGFSFENDGAFVEFDAAGNPTYLNYGCQVLSAGLSLSAGPDAGLCPGGATTASLTGSAVNLIGNPTWAGGAGSFSSTTTLATTYTPGVGETGIVKLTLSGNGACNTSLTDTVRVNIVPSMPAVSISASVSGQFTSSITDSTYFYNWFPDGSTTFVPFEFDPVFTPTINGCYYLVLSTVGNCAVQSNTLCITNVGLNELNGAITLNILNNPGANPSIQVSTIAASNNLSLQLIDVTGRIIRQQEISTSGSVTEIHPDWSAVESGIYLIRLNNKEWSAEGKVILTK